MLSSFSYNMCQVATAIVHFNNFVQVANKYKKVVSASVTQKYQKLKRHVHIY